MGGMERVEIVITEDTGYYVHVVSVVLLSFSRDLSLPLNARGRGA